MSNAVNSEISVNHMLHIVARDDVAGMYLTEGQTPSGYVSLIKPEFAEVFAHGVSDTLRGVMARNTLANGRYDALPHTFGVIELFGVRYNGETTTGFLPYAPSQTADLCAKPGDAVTSYHANLIHRVNRSLEMQRSPLRLATLALQAL